MKDLPEHEPRSDSWERIMLKKNFDSQLIKNLGELPAYDPSDTAWSSIEKRLDNTKRRIIWRPIGIAASIFGLLILAFFLVRQENVTVNLEQQISESLEGDYKSEITENENLTPDQVEKLIITPIEKGAYYEGITKIFHQKIKPIAPITRPRPTLASLPRPELKVNDPSTPIKTAPKEVLNSLISETKDKSKHEVRIYWKRFGKPPKIQTQFGRPAEKLETLEITRSNPSPKTFIKVKN
ncbi:MAG: hypothetical protein ACQEW9_11680 [Bacteroidota bacterium]